jgi:hypothetical protein
MFLNHSFLKKGLLAFLIPFGAANAEIIIHGTRVIYPSDAREITLQVVTEIILHWFKHGLMRGCEIYTRSIESAFMIAHLYRVWKQKRQSYVLQFAKCK